MEKEDPLTVVIGASGSAEEMRRHLVSARSRHVGIAGHVRGLRRRLARTVEERVILCIALDNPTLTRHRRELGMLVEDARSAPGNVRTIGLLPEGGMTGRLAELGCDLYACSASDASAMIDHICDQLPSPTATLPANDQEFPSVDECRSRRADLHRFDSELRFRVNHSGRLTVLRPVNENPAEFKRLRSQLPGD